MDWTPTVCPVPAINSGTNALLNPTFFSPTYTYAAAFAHRQKATRDVTAVNRVKAADSSCFYNNPKDEATNYV